MKHWVSATINAALFLLWSTACVAQSIVLSLSDGSFSVSGQLLSFDGEFYEIQTPAYGVLTLAASTTECAGDDCPNPDDYVPTLRVAGSASLGELLLPALIENFATQRGYSLQALATSDVGVDIELARADGAAVARFQITLTSTAAGYAALSDGRADIVMARRAPTDAEKKFQILNYQGGSSDPYRARIVGWENLRLYTNFTNQIDTLTISQLSDLTVSTRNRWPAADGDGPRLHMRGDADSLIALRQQLGQLGRPVRTNTGRDIDPGILYVTPNLSLPLQPITLVSSCGGGENAGNFSESAYPLSAPIYLTTSALRHPPVMRDFLDFTLSVPAQRVVERAGFLSRTPTEDALASDNGLLVNAILNATSETALDDLKRAVRRLNGYGRLSLTFRFQEGTRALDVVSQSNLNFAAELLQQGRYKDREVLFAGFSDGTGAADSNLVLSRDRATSVRDAIRTLMGRNAPPIGQHDVRGFGEALPLACNDTDWGQNQNRRVEIWIR